MQENFNTEDPLGILSSKDPLGILKKKDGGAQTSSGPSPSALQRLEELRKQLKENQLVPQRTELPKQVKQAKEKAEFLQSQEKKTPKVTQMMVYSKPTFKVEYPEQEELTAKVLGFQNAQQKVQFEQEDKEKQQQKAQQAADEFYNTGTGKLYYNFINPLANAGARAIGNTGATLARLANEDDLADAIVKRFTPEKRYEGTIAGTKPTKLQGGLFNDGKMDLAKLPSTIVRGLTDMAWLIAPAGMAGRAGQAAGLTERVAQGAGLVGTSFVQTREDYYQEGKAAGLKGEALDNFATGAAGLTSALEAVFPNTLALGGFKTKLAKDYAKQIANGITTKAALKAGVKEILKEAVVKEPIQEITQLAGDKVARTIVDMSTGENNFGDQFDWDKSKDEIYETLVITPIISTLAAGSGALRNYTPTNYEKAIFYDASKNADKVNQYLDNAFIQNEIAEDQYKEAKQKFANYNNAVNQVKNLGYSEDQTLQMAWELFSGKEKMPSTQSVVSDPILKDALGAEIKKDKEALSENIRLIGMGVPSVGAEIDGKEVSYVISNIGDKGTEIGQGLVDQIGEDKYRVEEVNVTDLYNTDQEFKQYVDSYKKGSISADAMLVPAVIKDGKIVDGRARLAESYLSGKNNIKVFKNISDAINQSQVQEGRTEGDLGQPQGIVQGQPEVGQGAGSQGQAQITPANVGDSNIGGQGQVAPGKRLFNEPNPEAAVIETEFKKAKGINTPEPAKITKLDEERSKRIADAYDQLVDSPNDPEVQQAYQVMADETMEQFDAIDKAGVKVEIWTGKGEPYKNSGEMIADVRDNKHMYIFSTEEGFGDNPITEEQRQQNALLRDSGIKDVNGKPLLINDIFRFVHDYFGHTRLGNSFGAIGEENAWNVHARMYSPLARRAMTTETRGQNSWVNFNKNFRNPDGSMKKKGDEGYVPPAQRPFADQKMALLPEEFSNIESSYSAMPTVAEELTRELISGPVENASKSLEATGITFDLIADPAEFDRRVEQLGGQRGTEGVFLSKEGKILLNEQKLKEGVFAGRIIWHEASHPVMNIVRNTNPDLYNRVLSGLKQVDNPAVKQAIKWANENYEGQGTIDDESIVETVAMVADGTLNLDTVPTGLKQSIIDFINLVARALGFNQVLNDTDVAAFKKLASQVADAITTGKDISQVVGKENVKEYMSNLESPELVGGGSINLQPRVTEDPAINVYESKETDDLPRRSLQDVYDQYEGKAVVINSDPTRVGELTLPSGKKIFMYGGPGYLSLKENVEGNVGFATTQIYKVNLWMKYVNELFGDKPGVTLVATQAPKSILSNSYALRYVMDGISQLPKSVLRSSDFKNEFFGKDLALLEKAFGEKAYNDFINKYKKADLSNPEVINGMIADMAYNVGDDNKPASFRARGAFVSNLIGGIEAKKKLKTVEGDTGYVSKKPTKYISGQLFNRLGINAEKVIREIGEPSLVDLYMNEGKWGMAVSGFETDPAMTIDAVQVGGVKHPLFNAKFPGKNPFILDGAYDVNQMFTPVEMVGPKGKPYTNSAAQMLSTSMYVKGKPVEEEGAFKYQATPSVGGSIQASAGKRLAPNGKPSNLTEQQYNQVRTPEFKNWFGDWENDPANASKVVDENGEPLVVYHGTTKKFDVFEKSKGYYDNWYGLGFYFTDSLDDVKTNYSENGVDLRQKIETTSKKKNIPVSIALRDAIEGNYTIPSFQNIVNPVYLDRKIGAKDAEKILNIEGDIVEKYGYEVSGLGDYIKSKIKDLKNSTFWDLENVIRDLSIPFNDNENIVGEVIRSIYETIGYDGIVMNPYTIFNKLENRDMNVDEDTMHYISFRPNQIKSATDNTGAFSTTDNRIQASVGKRLAPNGKPSNLTEKQYQQVRTPEFKNWFGDWENNPKNASKVIDENGEPLVVYHGSRSNVDFAFSEFNVPAEGVFFTSDYRTATWFSQGRRYNKLFFEEVKIPNNLNEGSSLEDLENYYKENLDPTARIEEVVINDENRTLSYRFNKDYDNESTPLGSNIKDAQKKLYNILLRDIKDVNESTSYPFYEVFLNIKKPHRIDAKGKPFYKTPFEGKEYSAVSVSAEIKDRGKNDGLIIKNTIEGTEDNFQRKSDTYIVFNSNQIKSATDNVGIFSTTDNRIQASVGNREVINGFYSPIEDRINTFKQPKASVQKWKEIVGVKSDEAVFSGMSDWLNTKKPDQQLSKEEVLQFMKDNRIEIDEIFKDDKSRATKYSKYQLPGGNNYKEVLITLPNDNKEKQIQELESFRQELKDKYGGEFRGSQLTDEEIDRLQELKQKAEPSKNKFRSTHFKEYNIITHLRMNTRTDADGNKVLFLEEVQSDWGQMGKKEGFGVVNRKYNQSELVVKRFNNGSAQVEDTDGNVLIPRGVFTNARDLEDRQIIYSALRELNEDKTVYPAPYVTNTNAWVKLGLKVALKEAVRQGADRIAWTTGEQQNERYDLRKQVDSIEWKKDADGTYAVTADKSGRTISSQTGLTPAKLEEVIGKDAAEKIVNSADNNGVLKGNDLAVGGKGMKAFYGDAKNPGIVANVAKALVKELTGKEGQIVPSRISSERNQDVIDRYNRARQYGNVPDALAKEYEQAQGLNSEQPAIDITPELSYAVTGGMPQFSVGNRPENNTNFKLAAFVMRKKAEGATDDEIASGIASGTGMSPEDIKTLIDNPEQYIRDMFPSMTKLQQDNLIQKAKVRNIYRGRQFGKPIDKAFTGLEVPQEYVDEYMQKTAKSDNAVKQWATDFKRKWLDPAKGLPDWVLAIKDFASGTKNIEIAKAAKTIERLKDEAKKIGFTDWDAFSNALIVAKDVNRYIPNEDGIVPADAYRAAAGNMFTAPDDQISALVPDEIKALPDGIIPYVYAMRGQIDNLTRDLIGNGYVTPEQAVTLENNIGAYVNRSYRMFNEMGYKPQPEVMNAAIKFLADDYVKKLATDKVDSVADQQIYEEAIDLAKKDVDAILNKKKNPYFNASVDRRNTGILQQRQDIPEPLRKLMGEYTDPGTVFMMTVAKQAALKGSSQYLNKLRENGMGTLFFEQNDPSRPASHSVQIAAAGTESMNPLGGLFTTPEIAEAIEMAEPTYNELTQAWMKLVGAVRWGKTVGSIATQFKNFESNLGFAVLNGYLMSGQNTPAFKAAGKYVKGQYSKAEIDAITEKAIRLNLVGQSVGARELKEMLGSGDVHDIALDISLGPDGKWGKKVAKKLNVFKEANKLYRLGDDFWKVYGYMTEREQLADARFNSKYDGLTKQQQDQIDVESSERVKNTWPTYDRVIEGAKFVSKRAPIFGNFISFQAESLRVLANSIKLAKQDMADPQLRHLGVRRAVGIAAYFGLRSAITIGLAKMAGFAAAGILGAAFGDDEEERNKRAIKQALPPFMRTSDLAVIRTKEPHKFTVISLSSLDPYAIIPNSLNAYTDGREGIFGKTMDPGVAAATTELFSSFLEPEMTFSTMWSVVNNIDPKTKQEIVISSDSDAQAAAKVGGKVWDMLEPSSVALVQRFFERKDKEAEILALGGARPYDVDLHKSFGYILSQFGKDVDAINREYNSIKYREGMSQQDKNAAEMAAEDKKAFAISKLNETYRDFINIGADPKVLNELINQRSSIKMTGFDKNTKNSIKTGKINKKTLFK